MKKWIFVASLVTVICSTGFAQQSYNASELKTMVSGGNLPATGSVMNSQSKKIAFAPCKQFVMGMMSQLRGTFPVQVLVDNQDQYVAKAWKADGVVEASCIAAERAMQMSQKAYQ